MCSPERSGALPGPRAGRLTRALPLLALLPLSCRATTAPPPLELAREHFAGTPASGPRAVDEAPAVAAADALHARLELRWYDAPPALVGADLAPLAARARSLVVTDDGGALVPVPALASGVRVGTLGAAPPAAAWSEAREGLALPGGTVAFEARRTDGGPERAGWTTLAVEVGSAAEGPLELALLLAGRVPPTVDRAAEEEAALDALALGEPEVRRERPAPRTDAPAPPLERRSERALLDPGAVRGDARAAGGARLALLVPAPRPDAPRACCLATLAVAPASALDESARAALLDAAREELAASAARQRGRVAAFGREERVERDGALRGLADPAIRRSALEHLARRAGAALLSELTLVADDAALGSLAAAVGADEPREAGAGGADEAPDDGAGFAWRVEARAWRWLARRAGEDEERSALEPELRAVLLQRAGELGRHPGLLLDAVDGCASSGELAARLELENRIFLEDGDPAARVRAFDWLAARGLAPEGYEPLAERVARRAALAAYEERLREQEQDGAEVAQ